MAFYQHDLKNYRSFAKDPSENSIEKEANLLKAYLLVVDLQNQKQKKQFDGMDENKLYHGLPEMDMVLRTWTYTVRQYDFTVRPNGFIEAFKAFVFLENLKKDETRKNYLTQFL